MIKTVFNYRKNPLKSACLGLTLLSGLMTGANVSTAKADPVSVQFTKAPGQALTIADTVYQSALGNLKGGQLETALIDLKHDGVAEIAVRFNYPSSCTKGDGCYTTVLQYANGAWNEVFQAHEETMAVENGPKGSPAPILVDNSIHYIMSGKSYEPKLTDFITGSPMAPSNIAVGPLSDKFNSLFDTTDKKYDFWQFSDGRAGELYAVLPDGAATGMLPSNFTVYSLTKGRLMIAKSWGLFGLGKTSHDDTPDIVVANDKGLEFWAWDDAHNMYKLYKTSYPSDVTPLP